MIKPIAGGRKSRQKKAKEPSIVLRIPQVETPIDAAIWEYEQRDGSTSVSVSLSRRYGNNLESIAKSFDPTSIPEIVFSYFVVATYFSEHQALGEEVRSGLREFAGRLKEFFGLEDVATQSGAATPPVTSGALQQQQVPELLNGNESWFTGLGSKTNGTLV